MPFGLCVIFVAVSQLLYGCSSDSLSESYLQCRLPPVRQRLHVTESFISYVKDVGNFNMLQCNTVVAFQTHNHVQMSGHANNRGRRSSYCRRRRDDLVCSSNVTPLFFGCYLGGVLELVGFTAPLRRLFGLSDRELYAMQIACSTAQTPCH